MRTLLLFIALFLTFIAKGQTCACSKDSLLQEYISCKPINFDNGSKLYWSYNCDSSWLTFKGSNGRKKIIFSLDGDLKALTTRLGYTSFTEFTNTFLVTNRVISGCCDPDDYYLHDKSSGQLKKYLGRAVFVSDNRNFPIVVTITKSGYKNRASANLNELTIYNVDTGKEFRLALTKDDIEKGMKNNGFMFPEDVFDTPSIIGGYLTLRYFIQDYKKSKKVDYKTIVIDLKKYSS